MSVENSPVTLSNMAGLQEVDKRLFPLTNISSIVRLFKQQLESSVEPDLALLSIIVGAVENSLTCSRLPYIPVEQKSEELESESHEEFQLPPVQYCLVETLYAKFQCIIKGSVDLSQYGTGKYATRELVKKVSDVIWNSLTRSYYKDRAHLQSLFAYLTGNKLDCFGVAFAVVAGCQILGFRDVHLALSEDHSWVVFGEGGAQSAEVTWHGKGNEDKRGQAVDGRVSSKSWLYVNGRPVVCTRSMEAAALVSAINPSQSAASDVVEVALLQRELLWLLYDLGHLTCYPMALGNLGDLEEVSPMSGRQPCVTLFHEAALSSQTYYSNQHVYPYTYQGGYFYRQKMFKEAFESWANASDVIRLYNYSRDDEEIYKEFLEIANDLIPHIMKVVSSGHSAHSILKDAECFAYLLRFYDGICQWEEGSATPVLHIGWAKPLVNTISKFDAEVRAQVVIEDDQPPPPQPPPPHPEEVKSEAKPATEITAVQDKEAGGGSRLAKGQYLNNNNCCKNRESKPVVTVGVVALDIKREEEPHPSIAALTMACGEKILNREYLLGGREPFVAADVPSTSTATAVEPEPASARPRVTLHSQKMKGLKDLLLAEKLNTHAISLQLTAQSQVQVGKRGRPYSDVVAADIASSVSRPKRKAANRE